MKKIIDSFYNEEETARKILFFEMDRTIFKRHIENKTYQEYYILISKYLIKKKQSFDNIKTIIKRHVALSAYLYIRDKKAGKYTSIEKISKYKVKEFDNFLDNGFTLKELLDNEIIGFDFNHLFLELYTTSDYKSIKKCVSCICDYYDKELGDSKMIYGLLNNTLDYFYYGCKFADLKYHNHSDLLISYTNNIDELKIFNFEVLDDNYLDNWCCTNFSLKKEEKERILGHIINIIIENDNMRFDKTMITNPSYYYEIMLCIGRKKSLVDKYYFFDFDAEKQIAKIEVDKIKNAFKFKYNGKKYIFTNEGISKI